MNFQTWLMNENTKKVATYMVFPEEPYLDYIEEVQSSLKFNGQPIKKDDFHATIRGVEFTETASLNPFIEWLDRTQLPALTAYTTKFSVLGKENALIANLESPDLHDWYNKVNAWLSVEGRFPPDQFKIFIPHLSLAYKTDGQVPKFDPRIHRIKIKFTLHKLNDENRKTIFSKNAAFYDPNIGFGVLGESANSKK